MTSLLPLDFWRQELGFQPWHFWGLADANIVPVTSKCNDVIREYSWQDTDAAGRVEIRSAIETAEKLLFDHIAYWPAPKYSSDTVAWPRFIDRRLGRLGRSDATGRWINVRLNEGQIQNLGIEAFTLLDIDAAVTYTDNDGDGLAEDASFSVPTTVTDIDEIAVYFMAADRLPSDNGFSDRWRIEPLTVTISAGTATIKGKRWLFVKPLIYEDKDHYPIDPTVNANFVTQVSIYRRYTYRDGANSTTDSQAALIWESRPCCWGCDTTNNSTDPSSEGWVAGRGGIRDKLDGIVTPAEAVYDAASATWYHPGECYSCCGEPDKVLIRYLAGVELDAHGWMQKSMRTLVTRLAAAEMGKRICACDQANREWSHWQFDVSRVNAPEVYQMNLDTLSNPLGTRRGHIYAWSQIKQLARAVGFLA